MDQLTGLTVVGVTTHKMHKSHNIPSDKGAHNDRQANTQKVMPLPPGGSQVFSYCVVLSSLKLLFPSRKHTKYILHFGNFYDTLTPSRKTP